MARTLYWLIRASGYLGTSGQSFRYHVTGAATGAAMSHYNITAWTFSSGPSPAPTVYTSPQTFAMGISFTQGIRAYHIKRTGSSGMVSATPPPFPDGSEPTNPFGSRITLDSHSILSGDTGSAASVTVLGEAVVASVGAESPAYSVRVVDNTSSYTGSDYYRYWIRFGFNVAAGSVSGYSTINFRLAYTPDNGPYNPELATKFSLQMYRRAGAASDYDWEFHENDSYTSLYTPPDAGHTGTNYVEWPEPYPRTASPDSWDKTLYLRYRIKGNSGAWTNYGAVDWNDTRSYAGSGNADDTLNPWEPS